MAGIIERVTHLIGRRHREAATRAGHAGHEEGAEWYDDLYATSESYRSSYEKSHYYFLWSVIADRIRRAGACRVLEIGCGPGQLASFLFDQGLRHYVGLDFSPRAIDMARDNAPEGQFMVGDARSPEIYDKFDYDIIICTEVLEHVQADLQVISRFRPGTRCICSVPNFPHASHVRFFEDAGEVAARYLPFFQDLDIMTLKSPRWKADKFFLFDGPRSDLIVSEV